MQRTALAENGTNSVVMEAEITLLREAITLQCGLLEELSQSDFRAPETIRDLRTQLGEHLLTRAKYEALKQKIVFAAEAELRARSILGTQLLMDARNARELAVTREELTTLANERDSTRKDMEALDARRVEIADALARAQDRFSDANIALEDVRRENDKLKDELANVYLSHSWRMTKPLRKLSLILQRLR